MSNTCNCPGKETVSLPLLGATLSIDKEALPQGIEPGDEGQHLVTRNNELAWENMPECEAGSVADYSTEEHWTSARWLDGNKIYRMVVDFGTLPNASLKSMPLVIPGLKEVTKMDGIGKNKMRLDTSPYPMLYPLIINTQYL